MLTLVGLARRRLFHNELFNQASNALAAVLMFLILLLLAGTQILDWRWLVPVSVVAAAGGLYYARKHLLSLYAAAQIVDHRLELSDTLSTAVYFQQNTPAVSPELRQLQMDRANQLAQSIDVRRAVPYAAPRGVYLLAVLALVAGSLFALRYGLVGHLDLKAPLAIMLGQQLGLGERVEAARDMRKKPKNGPAQQDDTAQASDPDQKQSAQPDTPSNDGADSSSAEKGDSAKGEGKKENSRNAKSGADSEQEAQAESNPSQGSEKPGQESGQQDQKQQAASKPEGNNNSGESSSLVNKAKDVLQNLLSSLKPPQSNPGNQQQKGDPNNPKGEGQPKQQKDKSGQAQNGQKGSQSEGQQGEQPQDPQEQKEQGSGKNDSQQGNKQPGSGAGSHDGDKRIKQAEDVAAMGKITELLGKRSATVTGEATVEVQSTNQQLKTAYTHGAAQHGQSGGEINRDEVPVAMQPYVQEYFKQARKQAPATTPPPKK